jgi:hypothetical protein
VEESLTPDSVAAAVASTLRTASEALDPPVGVLRIFGECRDGGLQRLFDANGGTVKVEIVDCPSEVVAAHKDCAARSSSAKPPPAGEGFWSPGV